MEWFFHGLDMCLAGYGLIGNAVGWPGHELAVVKL